MLLEYNANTNAQSTGGFTPLHLTCQDGHSDMTYLLLANHADPNIASKCHLTALHLCAQEDRVKCAEALVNKNANIDAQTLVRKNQIVIVSYIQRKM
jgi:ankyrin